MITTVLQRMDNFAIETVVDWKFSSPTKSVLTHRPYVSVEVRLALSIGALIHNYNYTLPKNLLPKYCYASIVDRLI